MSGRFRLFGRLFVAAAVLVLAYFGWQTIRPVLPAIVLAAAVASLGAPGFEWMGRRLGGRRRLASFLCVALLFSCVVVPLAGFGQLAARALVGEAEEVSHWLREGGELSARLGPVPPWLAQVAAEVRPHLLRIAPVLAGRLGELALHAGRDALELAIGLFLFAVAVYYFLVDGSRWTERMVRLSPIAPADTRMFFERFRSVSSAVLVGNLGAALVQAGAATLGYLVAGVPGALLWGAATLVAALIPVVGPALIWLPAACFIGIERGWMPGAALALYGLAVVGAVDNVVRPLLVKRGLQLHPLAVFVAVLGGLLAFGFAGLLVGPLVVALMASVLEVHERRVREVSA